MRRGGGFPHVVLENFLALGRVRWELDALLRSVGVREACFGDVVAAHSDLKSFQLSQRIANRLIRTYKWGAPAQQDP